MPSRSKSLQASLPRADELRQAAFTEGSVAGSEHDSNDTNPFFPDAEDAHPEPPPIIRSMLVVDDSYPMLKMLSFALTREGVQVTGAQTGEMALELMKTNRFDAVLIDLNMPKMDGYQLAYQFRRWEVKQRVNGSGDGFHGKTSDIAGPSSSGPGPAGDVSESKNDDLIPFVASITVDPALQGSSEGPQRLLMIAMSSDYGPQVQDKVAECGMDFFVRKPFTAAAVVEIMVSAAGRGPT